MKRVKEWILKNKDSISQIAITTIATMLAGFSSSILVSVAEIVWGYKNAMINLVGAMLGFSVPVRIYQVVLFIIFWPIVSWGWRKVKNKNNKLKIIEAKYFTDSRSFDITNELNDAIENNKLKIILSNNIAGDPYFGKLKQGIVKYKFNGREEVVRYREGDPVELPLL